MTDAVTFARGAFAVYEPDETRRPSRVIAFRFNPEGLQRQFSFEKAEAAGGGGAQAGALAEGAAKGADAALGALKESFTVALRFDLADREETRSGLPVEFGVLPEIAALEDLLHPAPSAAEAPADGSEPVRARGRLPLVLFVWGERRVIPVRITGMTVAETLFNAKLYPTRAEVEVALETLGEAEARDNTRVRASIDFTAANRRRLARLYLDGAASQSAVVNLPS